MAKSQTQTGVQGIESLQVMGKALERRLPKYVFHAIAKGLYDESKAWLTSFQQHELERAFKAQGSGKKIGKTFHSYTAGKSLDRLTLGIFTTWPPAEIYETGGTIRAQSGYLAVPVTPRAYTSKGRVKRSWRDNANPGRFKRDKFEDLRPVSLGAQRILLVRDVTANPRKGGGTQLRKPGRSGGNAVEPVFLLIKRTKRQARIQFFDTMQKNLGKSDALQRDIGRAVRALAGDVDTDRR